MDVDINPRYFEGTRLQLEARAHDKFLFHRIKFNYEPAQGATQTGQIGLSYDPNVLAPTPPANSEASVREHTSREFQIVDKAWQDISSEVMPTGKEIPFFTSESSSGDARLSYQGQEYVFVVVPPASAPVTLGTLWCEYECEFYEPKFLSDGTYVVIEQDDAATITVGEINAATPSG